MGSQRFACSEFLILGGPQRPYRLRLRAGPEKPAGRFVRRGALPATHKCTITERGAVVALLQLNQKAAKRNLPKKYSPDGNTYPIWAPSLNRAREIASALNSATNTNITAKGENTMGVVLGD
jgi:hypothetical protein